MAMSETTYSRAIELQNLAGMYPTHSSLFVPNFKPPPEFGLQDLESQGFMVM